MSVSFRIIAALVLFTASAARAQTVVAGLVVDRTTRRPLPQVSAELLGARDTVLQTAVTAHEGTFTLVAPQGGTYRVRLTPVGAGTYLSGSVIVADGQYVAQQFAIDQTVRTFTAFEVEKPVVVVEHSPQPRYPAGLLAQGISGCVLAQFVVDTAGNADRSTLRVLAYSHTEFVRAVYDAMPAMKFIPAETSGRKVPQLVQRPYSFAASADDRWECKPAK